MTADLPISARWPTRTALLLRAAALVALALIFGRGLVRNPHDNAYLAPAVAAEALAALAVPFVVAALLPAGVARRIGAWIALTLVWGIGGLLAAIFLFFIALIVGTSFAARRWPWDAVAAVHLIGAIALVAMLVGVSRRLFRA